MEVKEGFASTSDAAFAIGTNTKKMGDYRKRGIFEEKDFVAVGKRYFYHVENCKKAINEKIRGGSGRGASKSEEEKLEKENIPSKAISDARKAHYSAQKERITLEQLQGELIAVGDFKKALLKEAKELKDRFEILPERVAPQVAGLQSINEISELLHQEINDILAGLFERFTE